MAYKGRFKPLNEEKYVSNGKQLIYRSGLERTFMRFLDTNTNVIQWAYEPFSIPYKCNTDGQRHNYWPDFLIQVKKKDNEISTILIEIKCLKETKPPVKQLTKTTKKPTRRYFRECFNFAKNSAKWEAANKFAEKRGWTFKIITDKELASGTYA